MGIKNYTGSLLESKAQILVHQVNCQGKMGSGIAKTIRDAYPVVYEEYKKFCEEHEKPYDRLGQINIVKVSNKQAVCNMFGQLYYGYDGKRYISYDAVTNALEKLRDFCLEKGVKSVAFPRNMGCKLGGGKWGVVMMIIHETFYDTPIKVEVWEYDGNTEKK